MEKVKRFKLAYEYLKSLGLVHKQKDVASSMKISESNLSKAMNGDEKYLTDKFLARFNANFGSLFNNEWLISDEGSQLSDGTDIKVVNGKMTFDLTKKLVVDTIQQGNDNILIYPNGIAATKGILERLETAIPGARKINGKRQKFKLVQGLFDSDPTTALWVTTGLSNLVVMPKNELEALKGQLKALRMLQESQNKENEALQSKIKAKNDFYYSNEKVHDN